MIRHQNCNTADDHPTRASLPHFQRPAPHIETLEGRDRGDDKTENKCLDQRNSYGIANEAVCDTVDIIGRSDRTGNRPAKKPTRQGQENGRSEEHTSELQSLMRISYAAFCL